MSLLLTILSILAAWAFLLVLIVGLLLIWKSLMSIRARLEKIVMGVRAIEKQAMPLGRCADAAAALLGEAGGTVGAAARHLEAVDRSLEAAAPRLRPRQ